VEVCVVESVAAVSDSSSDGSVIIVSDSDESEDELECLTSVERPVSTSEQHQYHVADDYAAAVAAVFLNTTSAVCKTGSGSHDSSATRLPADVVNKNLGASCYRLDGNMTEIVSTDLCTVETSVPSSVECVTYTGQQNVGILEPVQTLTSYTVPQLTSSGSVAVEEMKLSECIAKEITDGLDSAACSELSDCLDPVELLSLDKCDTLDDVCNSTFLSDLSFIGECLVEDCGSSQQLSCSTAVNDVLKVDVQQIAADRQVFKTCTSEITDNHGVASDLFPTVERSADLVQIASYADDNGDACYEQSQSNADCSGMIASVDCKLTIISTALVDSSCEFTPVSASLNRSSPQTDEHLTSESQHQTANSPCESSRVSSVHLDVNAIELWQSPDTGDLVSNDRTPLMLSVDSGNVQGSCNNLTADVCCFLPTRNQKRPLPNERSEMLCKRFRPDSLDGELLTAFDGSTDICDETVANDSDTAVVSAASCLHSDVSSSHKDNLHKSNSVEFPSICCCCCKLPCDVSSVCYCTDGHACCIMCLQQQVKSLLSSPSKACVLSLSFSYSDTVVNELTVA